MKALILILVSAVGVQAAQLNQQAWEVIPSSVAPVMAEVASKGGLNVSPSQECGRYYVVWDNVAGSSITPTVAPNFQALRIEARQLAVKMWNGVAVTSETVRGATLALILAVLK
jgi:hypothetical protein